ncbi:MAG TPA: DUF6799 domain-containing protein [Planctomycetota bacterium]|nr:DUF6799 domain-containing protein [Planctomycetota bacterium]
MRNKVCLLALSFAVLSLTLAAAEGTHKDGYTSKGGKVVMLKDGRESPVTAEVTFGNGSRLTADGFIILKDGKRERFQDDRWIDMDGEYIVVAADTDDFDGYYYEGGKVYVMRDRTPVLVTADVVLVDGSRISADGSIVLKDGTRNHFSEGQRVSKEGKAVEGKRIAPKQTTPDAHETPLNTSRKLEEVKTRQPEEKAQVVPAVDKKEEKK